MQEELTIPKLYGRILTIGIPEKDEQLKELRSRMVEMLKFLEERRENSIKEGIIKINGSLDFPPEVLIRIFNHSDWNLELKALTVSFYNFYNRYANIKIIIKNEEDLGYLRINFSHTNYKIEVKNFIPIDLNDITSLNLGGNSIEDAGATVLAKALKDNQSLTSLNLWDNNIEDAGATVLAEALKSNKSLTSLNLENNSIGDAGARYLAETLKSNQSLTSLNLGVNSIGVAGATVLAEALKTNQILTSLDLGYNSIEDAGATALAGALKTNQTLTSLDLESNSIEDAGATALAGALQINRILTSLNLGGNRIGDAGATVLTPYKNRVSV